MSFFKRLFSGTPKEPKLNLAEPTNSGLLLKKMYWTFDQEPFDDLSTFKKAFLEYHSAIDPSHRRPDIESIFHLAQKITICYSYWV